METNINTARLDELQEAEGIGPVRASQIISYRDAIGGIASVEQLAEAASISIREAERVGQKLRIPAETMGWQNLTAALLIVVLGLLMADRLTYADHDHAIVLVVNVAAGLLICSLMASALAWFTPVAQSSVITAASICLVIAGVFLLVVSAIVSQLVDVTTSLETHITWSLMIFLVVALMYWFMLAATLQLRWLGAIRRDASAAIDTLARWMDGSMITLASGVALFSIVPTLHLPPLFVFWSAVMILLSATHLWGGESTYLLALSDKDCARIRWSYTGHYLWRPAPGRRFMSVWLFGCGVVLAIASVGLYTDWW